MSELPQRLATEVVLDDIANERGKQLAKWGVQHRENGTSVLWGEWRDWCRAICDKEESRGAPEGYTGGATWFSVLREEFAEAISEEDKVLLRHELVQTAAVCVGWIEDLDRHSNG